MQKRIRPSILSIITLLLLLAMTTACAPKSNSAQAANPVEVTSTSLISTPESPTATAVPTAETPSRASEWPGYTLAAELPESPKQMSLYVQALPAALPDEQRLAEIMEQLQITGMVSTGTSEGGETVFSVTGDSGSFHLVSDDPFLLMIEKIPPNPESDTPPVAQPADVRARAAEEFLSARGLLDFPYLIEPSRMSRNRDQTIRVVPLIDGYPLHDYDPLNGRLLVWFNTAGEISFVNWRPLKLIAGDSVNIVPATEAWDQLVNGDAPQGGTPGQCWQVTVFDPNDPYGMAAPLYSTACVSHGSGPTRSFKAATIDDVKLVYFAHDLSLGMSAFAFPSDSPARIVFPRWQFYGTTDDEREVLVLWPAIKAP